MAHMRNKHNTRKPEPSKRCKAMFICEKDKCDSTFECSDNLNEHMKNEHRNYVVKDPLSLCASPPRKKFEKEINEVNMLDLDNMELKIEKELNMAFLLEKRIKELECLVSSLLEDKKNDKDMNVELLKDIEILKSRPKVLKVSKHLEDVNPFHLPKLRGFTKRYKALGNGACLTNCVAFHLSGEEKKGGEVKKIVNHHIADNWDNFYENKIGLPYIETVVVGANTKEVVKNTKEEMLEFLRSDEALTVYSNSQELLAISNLFNININVFTYKGKLGRWSEICPHPEMVDNTDEKKYKAPDMALYNSLDTHYDLLVEENIKVVQNATIEAIEEKKINEKDVSEEWQTIQRKKHTPNKHKSEDEMFMSENNSGEDDHEKDINEIADEVILLEGKNSGHRRTSPNSTSVNVTSERNMFKCSQCNNELDLLDAHIKMHHEKKFVFKCDICNIDFPKKLDLEMHKIEHHENQLKEEWTCNNCDYQTNTGPALLNHLKVAGHQPSENIKDKSKLFQDYRQCYTCKLGFDGYWNLMNHRKNIHPSNKKCRNFPGNCTRGDECWYVHAEELMDVDDSFTNDNDNKKESTVFKCYICTSDFESQDSFMKHKKNSHTTSVPACRNFNGDKCIRTEETCWYKHVAVKSSEDPSPQNPVFHEAQPNHFPPDQMMTKLMMMMNNMFSMMEKKLECNQM